MRASYDKLLAVDEENIQETKVLGKRSHEEELESLVPEEEKHMEAFETENRRGQGESFIGAAGAFYHITGRAEERKRK